MAHHRRAWTVCLAALAGLAVPATPAAPAVPAAPLAPCWLPGLSRQVQCGVLQRPLDPQQPAGTAPGLALHFAVVPALARHKAADALFFFAGGPGQSAMELAGPIMQLLGRLGAQRDVVLIDQRGTGRSAPLHCPSPAPAAALALVLMPPPQQLTQWQACRATLAQQPWGDLRWFTTTQAVADAEAVRQSLGLGPVNLVAGSYGTRVALAYLRQFPASVRRVVLDGVVPPDMALTEASSTDTQAVWDALLADCAHSPACRAHYPHVADDWRTVLARPPQTVRLPHPLTGKPQPLRLDRSTLLALARSALYQPALAAALPYAISQARLGHVQPWVGLGLASLGNGNTPLSWGQHLAVLCAEDVPLAGSGRNPPGADWGQEAAQHYQRLCAGWTAGQPPADFVQIPTTPVPVLLLSGSLDPATPPRHGQRVAQALGPLARHRVIPGAGHGTLGLAAVRDAVWGFIRTDSPAAALAGLDALPQPLAELPRPAVFVPPQPHPPGNAVASTPGR